MDPFLWCSAYRRHPAYLAARAAGLPESRIVPVCLYWDGFLFNKKDSADGHYFVDLFTNTQLQCRNLHT